MYEFYETIKKQVDLQDLVEYLNDPLEKLKLLQVKLQDYKSQNLQEHKIEIEELIRETDKLEKSLFPDLINNYCKLSLEFRNNHVIKEGKNKDGNNVTYTSKDLLLKNMAKLIEHIDILDEKFYEYFSFDFLVNSRVISELGYQESFLDNHEKNSVVLTNQYVFSKEDAKKIIDQQLINTKIKSNPIYTKKINEEQAYTGTKLQLTKQDENEHILEIFNKRQIEEDSELIPEGNETSVENQGDEMHFPLGSISLMGIMMVVGFIIMALLGGIAVYGKVKANQEKTIAIEQQKEKIQQIEQQSKEIQQLNANQEKNNIAYNQSIDDSYKEMLNIMSKNEQFKQLNKSNKDMLQMINVTRNKNIVNGHSQFNDFHPYNVNVKNDKLEIEMSNVFKNQCQYMAIKLSYTYEVKVNNKLLTPDNMKEVCGLTNVVTVLEK